MVILILLSDYKRLMIRTGTSNVDKIGGVANVLMLGLDQECYIVITSKHIVILLQKYIILLRVSLRIIYTCNNLIIFSLIIQHS